ncbi:hypothetical protein FGB62_181g03 [Gracilaria domingensis]|nr:hypothetical protein FGB62_181g03 [Gracilaria domingensis]
MTRRAVGALIHGRAFDERSAARLADDQRHHEHKHLHHEADHEADAERVQPLPPLEAAHLGAAPRGGQHGARPARQRRHARQHAHHEAGAAVRAHVRDGQRRGRVGRVAAGLHVAAPRALRAQQPAVGARQPRRVLGGRQRAPARRRPPRAGVGVVLVAVIARVIQRRAPRRRPAAWLLALLVTSAAGGRRRRRRRRVIPVGDEGA